MTKDHNVLIRRYHIGRRGRLVHEDVMPQLRMIAYTPAYVNCIGVGGIRPLLPPILVVDVETLVQKVSTYTIV